jgi:hypothetical protein
MALVLILDVLMYACSHVQVKVGPGGLRLVIGVKCSWNVVDLCYILSVIQ